MIKNLKNVKNLFLKISPVLVMFLIMLLNSSLIAIFNNYGNVNAAEYVAENMNEFNKNPNTNRVQFNLITKENRKGWYYSNFWAVSALFNTSSNNSMYFSYSDDTNSNWILNSTSEIEKCNVYGFGYGSINYTPLNIKIIAGKMEYSDYNITEGKAKDPDKYWTIISESYANKLLNVLSLSYYEELIGANISFSLFDVDLYIKAICADSNLMTDFSKESFIVSNYFAFTDKFQSEKIIYKANPNNTGMNFSVFRQLFYSNGWQPPFESNEYAFSILECPQNETLSLQAENILYGDSANLSFISLVCAFNFSWIGFILTRNDFLFKKGKFVGVLSITLLYLFAFYLSFEFIGLWVIGNLHLIGHSLHSTIHELIGFSCLIFGMILSQNIKTSKPKLEVFNNEFFYTKIKI